MTVVISGKKLVKIEGSVEWWECGKSVEDL